MPTQALHVLVGEAVVFWGKWTFPLCWKKTKTSIFGGPAIWNVAKQCGAQAHCFDEVGMR